MLEQMIEFRRRLDRKAIKGVRTRKQKNSEQGSLKQLDFIGLGRYIPLQRSGSMCPAHQL